MEEGRKKKICIFPHYYADDYVPFYVKLYLKELRHYFDEILLVTNTRPLQNEPELSAMGIRVLKVTNEGYDLGMFHKGYLHIRPGEYMQVACVNDSNVVFGSLYQVFEWAEKQNVGFWGLFDSERRPACCSHENSYHIQSHFLVFNEEAIALLPEYFSLIDLGQLRGEKNIRKVKSRVIDLWEIGVTQFLLSKGLTCKAYIHCNTYRKPGQKAKPVNLSTRLYRQTIRSGVPVIKKRVITSTEFRHMLSIRGNWKRLIRRYGEKSWDTEQLISELARIRRKHIMQKFRSMLKP